MAEINYPLSIRTVLLSGYSRNQSASFSTTEVRSGALYKKKVAEHQPTIMSASFKFTSDEAMIFQSWFRNKIKMGFLPFNLNLCTEWGKVEYECQFLPDSLLPVSRDQVIWVYSAKILIKNYGPPAYVPDDISDFPEYILESNRRLLDIIVNTQLNKVSS